MRTEGRSWPRWRWFLTGLNILALVLTVILSWHYLGNGPTVGCGGGSPCEQVLNSHWSTIAGILPVSGLAVGVYLALLISGLFIGPATEEPIRRLAWSVMLILAGSVAGSAVWFIILQKWVIGDFCPVCMMTHVTGLFLAALVIWRAIRELSRPLHLMGLTVGGMILAGIMVAFQVGISSPAVYSDGESQDDLPVVDYHSVPIVGSPDAPYVVTLLFDYQCSHCQKIHFMLPEAVRRYDGKLAFVLCPAPLNADCNPFIPREAEAFNSSCELVKTGLAVWFAMRETFPFFEDWMFTYESGDRWRPRSPESAREKAVDLVGKEKFESAWSDPWIGEYLNISTRIYGQTIRGGVGGIPKLVFGSRWVIPDAQSADELIMILQKSLGVPGL